VLSCFSSRLTPRPPPPPSLPPSFFFRRALFKKWVRFEQAHGDVEAVEAVKDRAREYVASVTA